MIDSNKVFDEMVTRRLDSERNDTKFRTRRVNLVLFGGKAGVGKTTAAKYVQDNLSKYNRLIVELTPLAKPIKEIAYSVFKWDGNKDDKGRRLLQVIGTDAGREYNENLWVEYLDTSILGSGFIPHFVLVDDWRFPNEMGFFTGNFFYDVVTVRIENDRVKSQHGISEHPSEVSLPTATHEQLEFSPSTQDPYYPYNFSVFNNGTKEDLYKKLDKILAYLETNIVTY
jgi:hypothetical protein